MTATDLLPLTITGSVVALAGLRSPLKAEDKVLFFAGTAMFSFLAYGATLPIPLLHPVDRASLCVLLCGGFAYGVTYAATHRPMIHEGGLLLLSMTLLYAIGTFHRPWNILVTAFAAPFFFLLAVELFRSSRIGDAKRFLLSLLFSLCQGVIGLYQVSFWELPRRFRVFHENDFRYALESFLIQLTLFWAFFHLGRFGHLLLARLDGKTFEKRLRKEIIPEYAAMVDRRNVNGRALAVSGVLHGAPILVNVVTRWVPDHVMIFYLMTTSPRIVGAILARLERKSVRRVAEAPQRIAKAG